MMNRRSSRRLVGIALAFMIGFVPMYSQSSEPTTHLAEVCVLTDSKGQPKNIQAGFDVTSEAVVAKISIFYRTDPTTRYQSLGLKKMPNLRYVGLLPSAEKIEYYLSLKPEHGDSTNLLGGPPNPSAIVQSDVLCKKEGPHGLGTHKTILAISGGVAILLAIIGAGTASRGK